MNGSQQALEQACATIGLDSDGARLLRLGSNAVYHLKAPVVARVSRPGTDIDPVRRAVAVARWLKSATPRCASVTPRSIYAPARCIGPGCPGS